MLSYSYLINLTLNPEFSANDGVVLKIAWCN